MNARGVVIFATVMLLGAIGYAAGRLTSSRTEQVAVIPAPVAALTPEQANESRPALDELDDLTTVPFESVLYAVARATPESLRAYPKRLENIKETPARRAAFEEFFRTLMQTNPSLAKEMIFELDKRHRPTALWAVKNAAPAQAMPYVVDIVWNGDVGQISGCSFDYLRDALRDWSQTDPRAAKDYLEAHPDIPKETYYSTVLAEWAAYEPNEARVWMDETVTKIKAESRDESSSETESALQYIEQAWVEGLFRYDHKAAIDYVLAGSSDPDKDCAPVIVENLFLESPEQAAQFIKSLPSDRQATALRGLYLDSLTSASGDGNKEADITSPEFMANWMSQFSPDKWENVIAPFIGDWRNKDADELFAWMQSLPTEAQEVAIANYVPYLTKELTEKEFNTVMGAQDGQLRTQLLEQIMRKCDQSKDIMLVCLEKAPLSGEQKQYLAGLIPEQMNIDPSNDDD
jgi:hypothetical protein